ncbi:restriction endonuclease [Leptolyngbya sp. Heron Island J]|nr:restriction endonuclease [Leptolyngbya sp. Heron Island J]
MLEYQANGARLGWLLNPQDQTIEIYQPGQPVEFLKSPQQIEGGNILPGFVLNLKDILTRY